jgi:hypothetical protein
MLSSYSHLSFVLALVGFAFCAPLSHELGKRDNFNVGQLSSTPPSPGFGVGQFGSFNNLQLLVNDVNILQFALMLEVKDQAINLITDRTNLVLSERILAI